MVVSFADGSEPLYLGGETCGAMEVADCWLNAREFIHIIYSFVQLWLIVAVRLHVLKYTGAIGYVVRCVEGFYSIRYVEYECVPVVVTDVGMQGYAPHSGFGAKPSLVDGFFRYNYFCSSAVIYVEFLIVADCDIARLSKFISAQEGLVGKGGDHVD